MVAGACVVGGDVAGVVVAGGVQWELEPPEEWVLVATGGVVVVVVVVVEVVVDVDVEVVVDVDVVVDGVARVVTVSAVPARTGGVDESPASFHTTSAATTAKAASATPTTTPALRRRGSSSVGRSSGVPSAGSPAASSGVVETTTGADSVAPPSMAVGAGVVAGCAQAEPGRHSGSRGQELRGQGGELAFEDRTVRAAGQVIGSCGEAEIGLLTLGGGDEIGGHLDAGRRPSGGAGTPARIGLAQPSAGPVGERRGQIGASDRQAFGELRRKRTVDRVEPQQDLVPLVQCSECADERGSFRSWFGVVVHQVGQPPRSGSRGSLRGLLGADQREQIQDHLPVARRGRQIGEPCDRRVDGRVAVAVAPVVARRNGLEGMQVSPTQFGGRVTRPVPDQRDQLAVAEDCGIIR